MSSSLHLLIIVSAVKHKFINNLIIKMNLNKLPSYSGLNFIMSEYMNNKQNPISSEEQYEDIDINLLLEDVVTEEQAPNTDEDYWSEKTTKEIGKYAQLNLEEDE